MLIKPSNSKYYHYKFQINGVTHRGSTGTTNKRTAEDVERKERERLHSQQFLGEADPITLEKAVEEYLKVRVNTSNYKNVEVHVRKLFGLKKDKLKREIGCYGFHKDKLLHTFTSTDVYRLIHARRAERVSDSWISHEITVLKGSMKLAKSLGYKVNDHIDYTAIRLAQAKVRLRYLSYEEEAKLLHELDPFTHVSGRKPIEYRSEEDQRAIKDNYDLTILLLDTGMRWSEACGLSWSDIDIDNQKIHLYRPKVKNEAVLKMTDRVFNILVERRKNRHSKQRYVFENKAGDRRVFSGTGIKCAIKRAGLNDTQTVRERGGKVTIHTFRHTFASRLAIAGVSLFKISQLLGHSNITTTQRYSHLCPNEAADEAVSVLNKLTTKNNQKDNVVEFTRMA